MGDKRRQGGFVWIKYSTGLSISMYLIMHNYTVMIGTQRSLSKGGEKEETEAPSPSLQPCSYQRDWSIPTT